MDVDLACAQARAALARVEKNSDTRQLYDQLKQLLDTHFDYTVWLGDESSSESTPILILNKRKQQQQPVAANEIYSLTNALLTSARINQQRVK